MSLKKDDWVIVLDTGMRFLGKVVLFEDEMSDGAEFILNPAFEYVTQMQMSQGGSIQRNEAVIPLDLIGDVPLVVRPRFYFRVRDLPDWRRAEIERLVADALKSAEAYAMRRRSGIVLPDGGALR
jgi:hypothetical protein